MWDDYNEDLEDLYDQGVLDVRDLLHVKWPGGQGGLWSDIVDATFAQIPDVIFRGCYGFVRLDAPAQTSTRAVQVYEVSVNPLDHRVVNLIRDFPLHLTEFRHIKAVLHPETKALVGGDTVFIGMVERKIEKMRGETSDLTFEIASRDREFGRMTGRYRTDTDQRRHRPGDGGLRHSLTSGKRKTLWGGK
jgi:hypothetical protein